MFTLNFMDVLWYFVYSAAAFFVMQFLYEVYKGKSVRRGVPGPVIVPLLDNLIECIVTLGQSFDSLVEYTLKFHDKVYSKDGAVKYVGKPKTWMVNLPFIPRHFVTTDPECVEFALKTKFELFEKSPELKHLLSQLLGKGIFASDGPRWLAQRKATSQIFHVKNFREYFMTVFREGTDLLIKILDKAASEGTVVDLYDLFHRFTLDSFSLIGFGKQLHCLQSYLDGDQGPVAFAAAFDKAQHITALRTMSSIWPITEYFDGSAQIMRDCVKTINEFSSQCIEERRQDPDKDNKDDLLSRFMRLRDEETGELYSDQELRDTIMNLIIAGRDTTAQTLSWAFTELFKHPEVIEKIRNEFQSQITDFSIDDLSRPSYDEVIKLSYAKAVFYETLRLHPAVPRQSKGALEDVTLPNGVHLKKGEVFVFSSYVMGRLESIWGEDVLEFKPERFIDQNHSPYKFLAFNAGPRLCLGQQMAYLEAITALVLVLDQFDFKLAMPEEEIQHAIGLTLLMKNGLKVTVQKRN
ncbi:hypothetical protein MIR68_010871 [Amoeboaphelidium protococcarum]|nr:hypothetical protein MIR68_010871 [Amoeboaphelidium protococcarum]